jgi:nitroreductase
MPATLELTTDELLTTTRAVRKRLDFDRPVELDLLKECLSIGLQAPSGSNAQNWDFMVVQDANKVEQIGRLYQEVWAWYREQPFSAHALAATAPESEKRVMNAVVESAEHLATNMHRAPAMVIPCVNGRPDQSLPEASLLTWTGALGSLFPSVWSFMLAARSRGLGTCWTSLHLQKEREVAEILDIPFDSVTQTALISVGHTIGDKFRATTRRPLEGVLHVDGW